MIEKLIPYVLHQYGVIHSGFAPLGRPLSFSIYQQWLADGQHADMSYLKEHLPQKESPTSLLPSASHAIVFTVPYDHPRAGPPHPLSSSLKIAKYAKKEDYHIWLKDIVENICRDLKKLFPEEHFLGFTDSSPVMERDLAYQAGLGWFGKNSCLISRTHGSYFLIAEIYTSLPLSISTIYTPDHCGTCTRCIDACPTEAISPDRTLDSRKCISYWTIEAKTIPPASLRPYFSGWFFGCDICQDVCPWNRKFLQKNSRTENTTKLIEDLRWILSSSNKELERHVYGTPLQRTRGRNLKRNALMVIAHYQLHDLAQDVQSYTNHPDLSELALWALEQITIKNTSPN